MAENSEAAYCSGIAWRRIAVANRGIAVVQRGAVMALFSQSPHSKGWVVCNIALAWFGRVAKCYAEVWRSCARQGKQNGTAIA